MRTLILASLFVLAACGQSSTPASTSAPPAQTSAAAPAATSTAMSTGEMGAMSNTAMSITGSLTVSPTALTFENGFAAQTEFLSVIDATTPIAQGGQSFAEAAPGPTSLRVELRRIVGDAPAQLCGSPAATYVAIASDEPITGLTLIFFSGADAPGPNAHDSAVCATFSYGVD